VAGGGSSAAGFPVALFAVQPPFKRARAGATLWDWSWGILMARAGCLHGLFCPMFARVSSFLASRRHRTVQLSARQFPAVPLLRQEWRPRAAAARSDSEG